MEKKPLIQLENVWRTYQLGKVDLTVLRDVSLQIFAGSFVAIIGPSGSGKSTLLHLAGVLDVPSKGRVLWRGADISQLSQDELATIRNRSIGFVFQQFNLLPHLTAAENVMLPMVFRGYPEQERHERATKLLTSLKLGDRVKHRPTELSGGEQQRVAMARALANDPEMIVADEPTGNLDSATGKHIMELFADLHQKQGKTVIVVTHDPTIARYTKNVIHIKDGRVTGNHLAKETVLWKG